jgi:hypothetical protein
MSAQLKVGDRALKWISSVNGDPELLEQLDRRMTAFYRLSASRRKYQTMIDADGRGTSAGLCFAFVESVERLVVSISTGSLRACRVYFSYFTLTLLSAGSRGRETCEPWD